MTYINDALRARPDDVRLRQQVACSCRLEAAWYAASLDESVSRAKAVLTRTLLQKIVQHARALHKAARELRAALEERERRFRDAQDGVVQRIYAIGLGLEHARGRAGVDANVVERTRLCSIEQLNRVIREVREQIARYS